jgi:hypothetical protein
VGGWWLYVGECGWVGGRGCVGGWVTSWMWACVRAWVRSCIVCVCMPASLPPFLPSLPPSLPPSPLPLIPVFLPSSPFPPSFALTHAHITHPHAHTHMTQNSWAYDRTCETGSSAAVTRESTRIRKPRACTQAVTPTRVLILSPHGRRGVTRAAREERGGSAEGGGGVVYSGFGKMVALQESVAMILMALGAPKEALLTYSHTLDFLTDRASDVWQVAGNAHGAGGGEGRGGRPAAVGAG